MPLVLDNSVMTGWYLPDQATANTQAMATRLEADRTPRQLLELAMRYSLSSYDAAYFELAMRNGLPIASQDRKLREASLQAGIGLLE